MKRIMLLLLCGAALCSAKPVYVLGQQPCIQADYRQVCPISIDPNALVGVEAVLPPIPNDPNTWTLPAGPWSRALLTCDPDGDDIVVEVGSSKDNAYAGPFGQREDLFGFIDIIALDPDAPAIVAIQSTGPSGHAAHRRTILACEFARQWLECGGRIELWSWRKLLVQRGGKARRWQPRIESITVDMF